MARITLTLATIFCLAFTPLAAQNFEKGMAAAEAGDFATAYKEWLPLAKEGDPEAQFYLGHLYEIGEGVPKNQAEAVKWFKLSADQTILKHRTSYFLCTAREKVFPKISLKPLGGYEC